MIRMGWLALGLALVLSSGASAQTPDPDEDNGLAIATVTAVNGPLRAKLRAFTSFDAPSTVEVGAGSQVTIVHHRTCEKADFEGGKVEIGFAGFQSTGKVLKLERAACPGKTMAETSGVAGGVLMRSSRPGATGSPTVAMAIDGGPRVKAGASIRLTVTPGIRASVFVYDQDQSGVLTLIQKPDTAIGLAGSVPAGANVPVPDRPTAKIEASSDPGEGRVIAFAVPPTRAPCGYLDLFEGTPPKTLSALNAAIRARGRSAAACAPVPQPPLVGDLLYSIVR